MNTVSWVGNIAGDIYSGKQNGHPLLRLLLISGRPRLITGIRIVLLDDRAEELYTSLRKGSEIGVFGYMTTRRHDGSFVSEVEVRNLALLRNFSWADLETRGTIIRQSAGKAFIEGTIVSDVFFEWRQRKKGKFLGINDQYAFLKFTLSNQTYPDGLNIVVFDFLAELLFPYLRTKSEVAVDGLLRQDQQGQLVVIAENVALLRNIDYLRAAAAQTRLMQTSEVDEQDMYSIVKKPKGVPSGYTLIELCFYFRRSRQELDKAGILKRLKKSYPNGRQNPLYDREQVEKLEINLIRQDGLVAFKVLQPDTPLLHALEPGYSNELDCTCPECDGIAISDPRVPAEERAALIQSNSWPHLLWCFACGFVEITHKTGGDELPYRLLGKDFPGKT